MTDKIFELAAIAANNGLVKLSIRTYIKGSPDLPCEDKSGTWHGAVNAPRWPTTIKGQVLRPRLILMPEPGSTFSWR